MLEAIGFFFVLAIAIGVGNFLSALINAPTKKPTDYQI